MLLFVLEYVLKNLLTLWCQRVVSTIAFYVKIRPLHTLVQSISSFSRGLAEVFKFGGDKRSQAEPMWVQTKRGIYLTEFLSSASQPPPSQLTNLTNSGPRDLRKCVPVSCTVYYVMWDFTST